MPHRNDENRFAARHFLIAVGGMGYDPKKEGLSPLPEAAWELDTLEEILRPFGYRTVLPEIRLEATAPAILDALAGFFASEERTPDDSVIFYFTGHARALASGNLYLLPRGANLNNPARTAIRCANLAEVFFEGHNERPENVWVMLDVCSAGLGAAQLVAEVIRSHKPTDFRSRNRGFVTFAAAAGSQEAKQRVFVQALQDSIAKVGLPDPGNPFLDVGALIEPLSRRLGQGQQFDGNIIACCGRSQFLVNPRFDPRVASPGLLLDTARGRELREARTEVAPRPPAPPDPRATSAAVTRWLEEHSEPRSIAGAPARPRLFTGRRRALDAMAKFLLDPQPKVRFLLLAGAPGAGATATLAALCARPDVAFGQPTASAGPLALDVFVPSGEDPLVSVRRASSEARTEADETDRGFDWSRDGHSSSRRSLGLRVVIDARPEGEEPLRALRPLLEALRQTGEERHARFVVAVSGRDFGMPEAEIQRIDLDAAPWFEPDDLYAFVQRLFAEAGSLPGERAAPLARAVAAVSGTSFLAAELLAHLALRTGRVPDALPGVAPHAFAIRATLDALGPDRPRLLRLLLPLALAEGSGLPADPEWKELAATLSGEEVGGEEIERVKAEAAGLLYAEIEEGETRYRIAHPRFRDLILAELGLESAGLHRRIAERLLSSVPRDPSTSSPRWNLATPYARRHLAAHASKGGVLAGLLGDLHFVLEAAPDSIGPLLPAETPLGRAHARARPFLRRLESAADAAAALSLAALEEGAPEIASALERLPVPRRFLPRWVAGRGELSPGMWALGQAIVACQWEQGVFELLRAQTGEILLHLAGDAAPPRATALALGELRGRPVVAVGTAKGTLLAHEASPEFGVRILERVPGRREIAAVAATGDRVLSLEQSGAVRAWPGGTLLGDIGGVEPGRCAFLRFRGEAAVAKITARTLVRLWLVRREALVFSHGFEAKEWIRACASGGSEGRLAVVAGEGRDAFLLDFERSRLELLARVGARLDGVVADGAFAMLRRRGGRLVIGRLEDGDGTAGGGARPPPASG